MPITWIIKHQCIGRHLIVYKRTIKEAYGELETTHPGYLGCQDTYYVGNFKGIGKVYGPVFIESYTRLVDIKLYQEKTRL